MLRNTVLSRLVPAVLLVAPLLLAPSASAQVTGPAQSISIGAVTLDNKSGIVSIEVTVTCSSTALFADVFAFAQQTIGRKATARNQGGESVACGPTPATFTIVAPPNPFNGGANVGGGSALVFANLFACDPNNNCNSVSVQEVVQIKH